MTPDRPAGGQELLRPLDPVRDRPDIEALLARCVPGDYLLSIFDRWLVGGTLLGAYEGPDLVALQRLEDLGDGEGWIGAIRVDPPRRREGWGQRLTRYALRVAAQRGATMVRLTIEDSNTASRALARSLGFRSVLPLSHLVGLAPAKGPEAPSLRPVGEREVHDLDPAGLAVTQAMSGYWMTALPRPQRFVRATRSRLLTEARAGHLFRAGPELHAGLCLMDPSEPSTREGRRFRLLSPLGSDLNGIFRAASSEARPTGCELEGFAPVEGKVLPTLEAEGWRSGAHAFWGARIHLYEREP